mgnify:CR=1 FL=1
MPADDASINLTHHFLIAMPGMEDEAFARSVVYLCEHSARGALGLVINKPSDIDLGHLFDKVELPLGRNDLARTPVFQGGPVQTERGFVLHEAVFASDAAPSDVELPVALQSGAEWNTDWEMIATVSDLHGSGAAVTMREGVRVRMSQS